MAEGREPEVACPPVPNSGAAKVFSCWAGLDWAPPDADNRGVATLEDADVGTVGVVSAESVLAEDAVGSV